MIVRQWRLLLALDAHRGGLTLAQLRTRMAADTTVGARTIRRDLDALILAGFPIDVRSGGAPEAATVWVIDRSQWRGGARTIFAGAEGTH